MLVLFDACCWGDTYNTYGFSYPCDSYSSSIMLSQGQYWTVPKAGGQSGASEQPAQGSGSAGVFCILYYFWALLPLILQKSLCLFVPNPVQ